MFWLPESHEPLQAGVFSSHGEVKASDTIAMFCCAECPAVVGHHPLSLGQHLGQDRSRTHSAGVGVENE